MRVSIACAFVVTAAFTPLAAHAQQQAFTQAVEQCKSLGYQPGNAQFAHCVAQFYDTNAQLQAQRCAAVEAQIQQQQANRGGFLGGFVGAWADQQARSRACN